jgi:hypothetical protein
MNAGFIFAPQGSFAILKLKNCSAFFGRWSRCSDPIAGGDLVDLIPENNRLALARGHHLNLGPAMAPSQMPDAARVCRENKSKENLYTSECR